MKGGGMAVARESQPVRPGFFPRVRVGGPAVRRPTSEPCIAVTAWAYRPRFPISNLSSARASGLAAVTAYASGIAP